MSEVSLYPKEQNHLHLHLKNVHLKNEPWKLKNWFQRFRNMEKKFGVSLYRDKPKGEEEVTI